MNYRDTRVCIVGLGYVGLTLAVTMAAAGFRVHGVEISSDVLNALAKQRAHFSEKGLDALLANQIKSGSFSYSSAIQPEFGATVYIVTVGTPVGTDKRTKIDGLESVLRSISGTLSDGDLVILRSTVRIGTTRSIAKSILDSSGKNYDLAFCPERTLEGRALQELPSLPQIVGGIDHQSTFRAAQMFSFLTPSVIRVNDCETAETIKLVNNTQRDYLFAFANEVAFMCDTVGISASEVIRAANLGYSRSHLPMPGPVGGPCLEKDPYILAEGLEALGYSPVLSLAARKWNEALPGNVVEQLTTRLDQSSSCDLQKISILGLAFKGRPATDDLRGSMAYPLLEKLKKNFPKSAIYGWDAVAEQAALQSFGIQVAVSLEDAFEEADLVVIQNNHEDFEAMDLQKLSSLMRSNAIIYDFWNQHDARNITLMNGVRYLGLGASNVSNIRG